MSDYYKELVTFWVDKLVKIENIYQITASGEKNILINIEIDKDNIGKIIGKNGKIITSIRTLISSIANKNKDNVVIKVIEKNNLTK